ncbi:hypothetical protein NPIL_497281 [Nephila pilipes]|uniref:Uncharacterized protein n=1 Tax=Nephila pilipes TaxID=299642 RepID=A0A8X6U6H4_NEPPI|nr:hypothetical protein NPIL_497281 [Nephila pilipes]
MLLEESGACLTSSPPEEKLAIVPAVPVRSYFYSNLFSSLPFKSEQVSLRVSLKLVACVEATWRVHPLEAVGHLPRTNGQAMSLAHTSSSRGPETRSSCYIDRRLRMPWF